MHTTQMQPTNSKISPTPTRYFLTPRRDKSMTNMERRVSKGVAEEAA